MARGKLITIEGIEGAGKTTAKETILTYLHAHQINVTLTREPGGTPLAENIRKVLLDPSIKEKVQPETELLLMFACRSQVIKEVVTPALDRGDWVVSDRYVDASYAYQGGGRQLPEDQIQALDKIIVGDEQPALTLLLDLPAELGLERAKSRGNEMDRIELEKIAFFGRVRDAYLARAQNDPSRIKVIQADQSLESVSQSILHHLETFLTESV